MVNVHVPNHITSVAHANESSESDLVRVVGVSKTYTSAAGDFHALKNINLTLKRGEFVAVVGKSGSGKSTLANMVTGIDRPTSGDVWIAETKISALSEEKVARWRGRQLGIVFQAFELMPILTLVENVMLPMDFARNGSQNEQFERAMDLLKQVGVAEHAYKLPSATSGGQQQRTAIARALANDPPLIVADEPTGNLDSQTAEMVFDLFQRLVEERNTTIMMVTHDDELAMRGHRAVSVIDGRIVDI
jgi:putative ABC transport system ATP-binding protein